MNKSYIKKIKVIDCKLLRTSTKAYKRIWDFHKGDDDIFPSVPHGHSTDRKFVLKLWTGDVFLKSTGKQIGKASKKEMMKLYNNIKMRQFVDESRIAYLERNPRITELEVPSYLVGKVADTFVFNKHMKKIDKVTVPITVFWDYE